MSLLPLSKLTGAKWSELKKAAGVKGGGFFDSSSGKGIGKKIDNYQAKLKACAQPGAKSFRELFNAVSDLESELAKAVGGREFTGQKGADFQKDVIALHAEVKKVRDGLAKIGNDTTTMQGLEKNDAKAMEAALKNSGLY